MPSTVNTSLALPTYVLSARSLTDLSDITTEYLETALWSSLDDDGDPLDLGHGLTDLDAQSVTEAFFEVASFIGACTTTDGGNLTDGLTNEMIGHNLWLNRNGHGCGFWDRGLGAVGDKLSDIANSMGTADLYVGDDGELHIS